MSGSLTRDPITQHILKDETDIPALGYKGETDIPALGQGVSGHHRHSLVQLGEEKRLIRVNEGLESHPSPVKGEVGGWRGCAGYEINERRESRGRRWNCTRSGLFDRGVVAVVVTALCEIGDEVGDGSSIRLRLKEASLMEGTTARF
ncbi:hypothetical protein L2E82_19026 [Cichorium intybus]|uniref:Uncharacterized protein n=1 Tax=Cichorium intybus TaxID=13427 RepID=A0ACB9FCN1_CICIN|nr:hypothetical protein L2E82_19026 [Cichorium intybus]